mgnify:CR=1 FL=1
MVILLVKGDVVSVINLLNAIEAKLHTAVSFSSLYSMISVQRLRLFRFHHCILLFHTEMLLHR